MSVTKIASRYAKSLLDLAIEQNKLDRVLEDVQAFKKSLEVRDLYSLLKSPIVNPGKKITILKEIFDGKFDELTMGFINLVLNKNRGPLLPEMADTFIHQYHDLKNISTVQLTTASAWTDSAVAAIRKKLLGDNGTHNDVEIITKVDPKLIGGFVLEFENKLYDASVLHNLEKLRKEFSKN